ncbi:Cullin-1 [Dichanthelium oligosanthes]|uniref:Cullin-1 n=1 Tax=Dichanthelium oligosanthes TaxID=888268 RepID=A0A1E5VIC0_9POAL|nr:Cullin-1 [Dichanthelium oligosanthes]
MKRGGSSVVDLEEGWRFVAAGIAKIRRAVEDDGEVSSLPIMELYSTVFFMCTQKPPHDYSRQLYQRYKEDVDSYNKSTVLPSLRDIQGEILLRHLVERWRKHEWILKLAGTVFRYPNRYYIPMNSLPTIEQVGSTSFRELVFNELKNSVTKTVIGMVDFEQALFCKSYSTKAQTWILEYSHPDYMLKHYYRTILDNLSLPGYLDPAVISFHCWVVAPPGSDRCARPRQLLNQL